MKHFYSFALAIVLTSCGGGTDTAMSASYPLKQIAVAGTRLVAEEKLSIKIVSVNDSRCPATAVCVTAGQVTVQLLVQVDGVGSQLMTLTLGRGDHDNQATFAGLQFVLDKVSPYPVTEPVPQDQYGVDITIHRL